MPANAAHQCHTPTPNFDKIATQNAGFTLIELVVGIVVFSVALVMLASVIMPQTRKGIDPIWQVRAVTLGQSLLNEIGSKAFDESSITSNGRQACDSSPACTASGNLGPDEGARNAFDDIDDFDGLVLSGSDIANASETNLSVETTKLFQGFTAEISVFYDANYDGINDDDLDQDGNLDSGTLVANQKRIEVIVITPEGEKIPFSTYRNNF